MGRKSHDEVTLLKRQLKKYQHELEISQLEVRLLKKNGRD